MRVRIEVYPTESGSFEYMASAAIGAYGRFIQIAQGYAATAEQAEQVGEIEAKNQLTTYKRSSTPVVKKYINVSLEEL